MTASKRTAIVVTEAFGRSWVWLSTLSLCAVGFSACTSDGDGGAALGGSAGASGGSAGSSAAAGSAGSAGASSGGAAGSSAAGSGGLGGAGSGVATCPAGALFCDDFEEDAVGQPPAAPWSPSTNAGTVAVDSTRAFSGSKAVLASAPNGPTYRRAFIGLGSGSPIFPGAASEMYGRAMIWLEAAPTEVHWTMIQAQGPAADGTHNAEYRYGGPPVTELGRQDAEWRAGLGRGAGR